jgi:hypothetical protein
MQNPLLSFPERLALFLRVRQSSKWNTLRLNSKQGLSRYDCCLQLAILLEDWFQMLLADCPSDYIDVMEMVRYQRS